MNIKISSPYPEFFTIALASILKLAGSVNIITNGEYTQLLFDGADYDQERNGIYFNASGTDFDYQLVLTDEIPCEYHILYTHPRHRDLVKLQALLPESPLVEDQEKSKYIVVTDQMSSYLKFGYKYILSVLNVPQTTTHYEIPLDEHDLVADFTFGMNLTITKDKLSKTYQNVLLQIFNVINNTSYTKLKQIKPLDKVVEEEVEIIPEKKLNPFLQTLNNNTPELTPITEESPLLNEGAEEQGEEREE